ncbi:MAG: RtcB family protein, partial [Candidatus Magasanikbacteria bacterium]
MKRGDLEKIEENVYEISKNFREDMEVPGRVFASDDLLDQILDDNSLDQVANVATLPGIEEASFAMPDAHQGYGMPVGGVAAFSLDEGIISP